MYVNITLAADTAIFNCNYFVVGGDVRFCMVGGNDHYNTLEYDTYSSHTITTEKQLKS